MIEGETPATHFKLWIFHILSIFNLIQYWFNHNNYFFILLYLGDLAEEEKGKNSNNYLNWKDKPIAYWKVLQTEYDNSHGKGDEK